MFKKARQNTETLSEVHSSSVIHLSEKSIIYYYKFKSNGKLFNKMSVNFSYNRILCEYSNFFNTFNSFYNSVVFFILRGIHLLLR